MFITSKGIFVIESKNYSGWIFGNEADRYWTVSLPGGSKERFYNPILQNKGHLKWLGRFLENQVPLFSVIAFSERCELKKVTVVSDDIKVIKRDRLYVTIRSIWDASDDVLSSDAVENLYEKLQQLTNVDKSVKVAHVSHIEKNYKGVAKKSASVSKLDSEKSASAANEEPELCPRCGGNLVLRTAKKGANAGNKFYGCSNYPKCRFVRNVEIDTSDS